MNLLTVLWKVPFFVLVAILYKMKIVLHYNIYYILFQIFQPSVRFEACRGLYRLSLIKENSCLIQLMDALLDSLPLAQSLQSRENSHGRRQEPSAREYFSILCRLVDGLPTVEGGQKVKYITV